MVNFVAGITFWFGAVGAPFTLLLHPAILLTAPAEMTACMAPVGIGYAWGAKWMQAKYGPYGGSTQPSDGKARGDAGDTE
ncbi:MAG: hypothetical protein ACYS9X_08920 [Planctomycetota bacterium]